MSVNSEGPAPHFQHRLHPQPQPRPSWESELPPTGGTTTAKQINKNKSGFYLHTWLRCVAEWKTWGEQEWSPQRPQLGNMVSPHPRHMGEPCLLPLTEAAEAPCTAIDDLEEG